MTYEEMYSAQAQVAKVLRERISSWKIFRLLWKKCVGHSLKLVDIVQKIWAPLRKLFAATGVPSWLCACLSVLSLDMGVSKCAIPGYGRVQVCYPTWKALHTKRDKRHFHFEASPNTKTKEKKWETWHIIYAPFEKAWGHVLRVHHQIAPIIITT